ncbi:hypothetical protein ACJBU6_08087 [Exserohilum turcicum]
MSQRQQEKASAVDGCWPEYQPANGPDICHSYGNPALPPSRVFYQTLCDDCLLIQPALCIYCCVTRYDVECLSQ